jgi:hypothetical protein
MIEKQKFIDYLNFIHFQLSLVDENINHKYIRGILNKIRESFPRNEDGFCELEFYCFYTNFATLETESNYGETPQKLFDRLAHQYANRSNSKKQK